MRKLIQKILGSLIVAAACANPAMAQPYDFYVDTFSDTACDLINATNVELVVFSSTGELVIVSGADLFLADSFVDDEGNVIFDGEFFGFIGFADDGDGLRSIWWLTDLGTVVAMDLEFYLPYDSGIFPDEFIEVPCDACPFWDIPEDCEDIFFDSDDDGVSDDDDLCPSTFPGEIVDFAGCSCEDLGDCDCFFDSDLDDVSDCDDFCEDTPIGAIVDFDGCACFELDEDDDGINDCDDLCPDSPRDEAVDVDGCTVVVVSPGPIFISCGNFSSLMLGLTFTGLFLMRFTARRGL